MSRCKGHCWRYSPKLLFLDQLWTVFAVALLIAGILGARQREMGSFVLLTFSVLFPICAWGAETRKDWS